MSASPYGEADAALEFALDHIADAFERTDFLQCWRDGDVSEWPQYASWLHANYYNKVLRESRLDVHGYEAALRDYARTNGPCGSAWNLSSILNCIRNVAEQPA